MRFDVDLVRSCALFELCGSHRCQRLWFPPLLFSHSVTSNSWQPHGLSGFPVLYHLPEFAQTHVHWVSVAIQPSHPLSSSSLIFNISQHQCLFQWVGSLHQVAKVLVFQLQHQFFQWIFRVDFLQDWLIWSPCSPRVSCSVLVSPIHLLLLFSGFKYSF